MPAPYTRISVLCPTYGRTKVLSELVESFRRQTYPAELRELVILNDRHDQTLHCDVPGVEVINTPIRYPTLGEKRNELLGLATSNLVTFWDDDDIYLPNRLQRSIDLWPSHPLSPQREYRASMESHLWYTDDGERLILQPAGHMHTMLVEKQAIKNAGGFPPEQMHQDVLLVKKLVENFWIKGEDNTPGMPTTIYRRGGTPYQHVSDLSPEPVFNEDASAYFMDLTDNKIAAGDEPTGTVTIVPRWSKDWLRLATQTWGQRATPRNT